MKELSNEREKKMEVVTDWEEDWGKSVVMMIMMFTQAAFMSLTNL